MTLTRNLDLDDQGQGHKFSSKAFKQKKKDHQSIMFCYKVVHVKSLICTTLGQCQGRNFITTRHKNKQFLPLHRPYKFLCTIFIILPIFTLE